MNAGQRILWHGLWVLVACTAAFSGLFAQTAHAATGERVALLIGNARYSSGLPPLVNPPQDVAALEASLKKLGFRVQVLKDGDQKAMGHAIKQFGTQAQEAQVAFFYYSGHGMQARDENYLIPVGAGIESEADLDIEAVALRSLMRQIDEARPHNAVVVLDACRDNPVAARTKSASKGLSRINSQPTNTLVVFAALAGNTASDNGVFAKALASHITQPNLGLRGVFDNVNKAVRQASGNKQSIQRDDQLSEDVVLASVLPEPVPFQSDAEQETWDMAKRRDTVASYQVYLNRYPSGRYAQTARDALAGLQPASTPIPTPTPTPTPAAQSVQQAPAPAPVTPAAPAPSATAQSAQAGQSFRDCQQAHCPELVVIPAGSFTMGSNEVEDEMPPHKVTISGFAAGRYAITKGQFAHFVQSKSYRTEAERGGGCHIYTTKWEKHVDKNWRSTGFVQEDDHPVVCVSWNDAKAYVEWLSEMTGQPYRLLSEAEREYVTRAGSTTAFWWGDSINSQQANYNGNYSYNGGLTGSYRQATMPVNSFLPNPFGLHNVHGNVWEWVEDCFHNNYSGAPADGRAWTIECSGNHIRRVLRGGSWGTSPTSLRSANRFMYLAIERNMSNGYGFRVARNLTN